MAAGARGELLKTVPIVQQGRKNDVPWVIGIYAGGVVLSMILTGVFYDSAAARVVSTLFVWAMWIAIAYLFVAIGTKLAHNMATWGIALVAGVLAVLSTIGNVIALSTLNTANNLFAGTSVHLPGAGTYGTLMVVNAAVAAIAFTLTVKMSRAMKNLSSAPAAPGAPAALEPAPQQPNVGYPTQQAPSVGYPTNATPAAGYPAQSPQPTTGYPSVGYPQQAPATGFASNAQSQYPSPPRHEPKTYDDQAPHPDMWQ
ncbi:hypothetical protein [Williamsia sterculiae]|nr:hypothetical protein [Williamsia sterculiae]